MIKKHMDDNIQRKRQLIEETKDDYTKYKIQQIDGVMQRLYTNETIRDTVHGNKHTAGI